GTADRREKTQAFLEAVYRFEGEQQQNAVNEIQQKEIQYFRLLIEALEQGKGKQIDPLDSALQELVNAYKCLQPVESDGSEEPVTQKLTEANQQNQQLREDLSVVRNQMSNLVDEFSDLFGGGQGNRMTIDEVMEHLSEGKAEKVTQLSSTNSEEGEASDSSEPQVKDESGEEAATREPAAQEESAQDEAAQEEAIQEEAIQEEAAQEEAAQDEAAQDEAAQEEAIQEEAIQEEATQEEATQDEAAQEEMLPPELPKVAQK
ncbi:MAG: hypothetical protein AAF353_05930, partial [Pseudomonadota bacterium]